MRVLHCYFGVEFEVTGQCGVGVGVVGLAYLVGGLDEQLDEVVLLVFADLLAAVWCEQRWKAV